MVPGPVKKDTNNWAPRLGFAWSPRSDRSLLGNPGVQARRLSPQFGSRVRIPSDVGPNGVDTEARATYNAGFITVNKRFSHGFQAGASYTVSRLMSNNDASLGEGGTTRGSSQRPQDYFDYAAEWSAGRRPLIFGDELDGAFQVVHSRV